jgi:uncharacterized Zn finger protein (UPF0148 family)
MIHNRELVDMFERRIKDLARKAALADELASALNLVEFAYADGIVYCPWCGTSKSEYDGAPKHTDKCVRQDVLAKYEQAKKG